jgi:subtilisin family serine protease
VAKIGNFEPREILALNATQVVLNRARSLGFTISHTVSLNQLNLRITRLRTPANQSPPQALRLLQRRIPNGDFALNHVYRIAAEPCPDHRCYGSDLIGWDRASGSCGRGIKLGMVDTAVNGQAPALAGRRVEIRSFADDGRPSSPTHGTAVAALLVGATTSEFPGLLPEAELYAADTFIGTGGNLRTNALLLGRGLDWLLEQQAAVVNVSLTGPDNRLLHKVIKRLSARNVAVVAAAGNGGPSAPPAFPAAYPEAIAVTAVDNLLRPYRSANRGEYVTVAAPGVRIWTPGPGGGGQYRDGTSFAAPYGTAVAALLRQRQPGLNPATLVEQMRNGARDLGAPGKDPVFGWGLLQSPGRCE